MALTRKFLTALGVSEDAADQIIEAHRDTVNGLTDERDTLRHTVTEQKERIAALEEAEKKLGDIESSGSVSKADYEAVKKELDGMKEAAKQRETRDKKTAALKKLLSQAGVDPAYNEDIAEIYQYDQIEFADDGSVKDADKLVDGIKAKFKSFIRSGGVSGANVENPPANSGGKKLYSQEEINNTRNTLDRQKMMKHNFEIERANNGSAS